MVHQKAHRLHRTGWLRAAVLGANDGIVSTASLIIGVAASGSGHGAVLIAGVAGLVAGASSMAAGEYVSVSSQADTEAADLALERQSLAEHPEDELKELTAIYRERGLDADLAKEVALQLMAKDALAAHARDDIGITEHQSARPLQAALASALAFTLGALIPLVGAWLASEARITVWVAGSSLLCLATTGGLAARAGGAPVAKGMARVTFWGALAMIATAVAGSLVEFLSR